MATSIANIAFEAAQMARQSNEMALEAGAKDIEGIKKRRDQRRENVEKIQSDSVDVEDRLARDDVGGISIFGQRIGSKEGSMRADLIRMSGDLARENESIKDLSSQRADILDDMKSSDSTAQQLQRGFDEVQQRTLDLLTRRGA